MCCVMMKWMIKGAADLHSWRKCRTEYCMHRAAMVTTGKWRVMSCTLTNQPTNQPGIDVCLSIDPWSDGAHVTMQQ